MGETEISVLKPKYLFCYLQFSLLRVRIPFVHVLINFAIASYDKYNFLSLFRKDI